MFDKTKEKNSNKKKDSSSTRAAYIVLWTALFTIFIYKDG